MHAAAIRNDTMLRVMLDAPGSIRLERVPIPVPGPHDILLRVQAALTCGTDIKTFQRGHPRIPLPCPFGHEFSGTVAAVGTNVTEFREGDPIACVPTAPCGECRLCRKGLTNLCPAAIERMVFGGFGEFVLLPAHLVRTNVYARPAGLPPERAAMLEPLACVVHGADRIDLESAGDVMILGDGPIGLLFARLACNRRTGRVTVAGRHESRLAVAASFGAQTTTLSIDELVARYAQQDDAPDTVLECVGDSRAWEAAVAIVAPGGRVLLYGGCAAGTRVTFDAFRIHYDEIDIKGAFHYRPENVRTALALLAGGRVDVAPLITHTRPLDEFEAAFSLALDRSAIKVAILPPGTAHATPPDTAGPVPT